MLPRPVLLRPVADSIPLDPLPFHPIDMELLVPIHVTPHSSVVLLTTEQRDSPSCYRYVTVPSPQLDPELRFIGGSLGVALFIDDRQRCLEVRRLITLPKAQGSSLDATVLRIALPQGVESQDIYLGHMAASTSRAGSSNWLPAGITSIMLVSRTEFFGIRAEHSRALTTTDPPPRWSRLQVTEPPEGGSLEQGQRRTFVSILLAKDATASYYLLDASKRLALVTLSLLSDETIMELLELPMERQEGVVNELLEGNVRMAWLLHLPKWDHSGDNIVCLAYRQYDGRGYGRFVAFNLVEQMPRHWAQRLSLGAGYCVFIGWGTGASAFGYRHPGRVGLLTNHIFDCQKAQHGLLAYHMDWNYADSFQIVPPATSLAWPFPLWREPCKLVCSLCSFI